MFSICSCCNQPAATTRKDGMDLCDFCLSDYEMMCGEDEECHGDCNNCIDRGDCGRDED